MTTTRVKTSREEFEAAYSGGYVYGYLVLVDQKLPLKKYPVYVELGSEIVYRGSLNDDPKTDYKCFSNSTVFIAQTDEMLDSGNFFNALEKTTTIIYY